MTPMRSGPALLQISDGASHAGVRAVVAGRLVAAGSVQELLAVIDGAVDQAADGDALFFVGRNVADTKHAVEVADRLAEAFVTQVLLVTEMDGESDGEGEHRDANRGDQESCYSNCGARSTER